MSRYNTETAKLNSTKPTWLRSSSHWNQEQNMGQYQSRELLWYYQWCLRWNCPFQEKYFQCTTGKSGKAFIEELTFWIKQFNSNSDLNSVALKAFMVLPTLILQKLSATSKGKDHSSAIERRLNLWRQGDLDLLLKEVRFIQGKFVNSKKARTVEDISKVLGKLVFQGKLSAAILSFWIARAQQAYSTLHQKS